MSRNTLLIGTERATGRTTRAIQMAAAFNATIVTPNERMARSVLQRAREIGREVDVVSASAVMRGSDIIRSSVIVDDADTILADVLHHPIAAMTICGTYLKDWS